MNSYIKEISSEEAGLNILNQWLREPIGINGKRRIESMADNEIAVAREAFLVAWRAK